jgi:2-dehydro-3-deoxygluconokinase
LTPSARRNDNEEDCQRALGIALQAEPARHDAVPNTLDLDHYGRLCATVLEEFPNLCCQAITLRTSHSASHNEWSACLCTRREFLVTLDEVQRFAAGEVGGRIQR